MRTDIKGQIHARTDRDPRITVHIGRISFQGTAAEVAADIARWFPRMDKDQS